MVKRIKLLIVAGLIAVATVVPAAPAEAHWSCRTWDFWYQGVYHDFKYPVGSYALHDHYLWGNKLYTSWSWCDHIWN